MVRAVRTTRSWRRAAAAGVLAAAAVAAGVLVEASPAPGRTDVVVMARPGHLVAAEQAVRSIGGHVTSDLSALGGFSAELDAAALPSLSASPSVASVSPDGSLNLLDDSTQAYDPAQDPYSLANIESSTGVSSLWSNGTGSGVGVALIDSGVTRVPGLLDQVVDGPNFSRTRSDSDGFGHGTFMAGIIAGDQDGLDPAAAAGDTEDYFGVAPGATLVSVKVADSTGATSLTSVLQGINWVINNRSKYNFRVINLSFGTTPQDAYVDDPLAWAVEQAWQAGIAVVVSAGNNGPSSNGLDDPAYDPFVIAVGAEDTGAGGTGPSVASFSNWGDGTRNPDVIAPGAHIQSVADPGSDIYDTFASTGLIDPQFFRGSGTSEAAAFTSGLVALLVQEHPGYSPDQIKALLVSSAQPLAGVDPRAQGAGVVDPAAAAGPLTPAMAAAVATPQSFPQAQPPGGSPTPSTDATTTGCSAVGAGPDMSGQDLSGQQLQGDPLSGADLEGADLQGADLQGAALAAASLAGADLSGANLSGANLTGASLSGANLAGANLTGTDLQEANLTAANLTGANLSGANLAGVNGQEATVTGANLGWGHSAHQFLKTVHGSGETSSVGQACATVDSPTTAGATATGSSWSGSSWSGSSWSGSSWSGSSWSGSSWSGSSWSGSSWSTATWT